MTNIFVSYTLFYLLLFYGIKIFTQMLYIYIYKDKQSIFYIVFLMSFKLLKTRLFPTG